MHRASGSFPAFQRPVPRARRASHTPSDTGRCRPRQSICLVIAYIMYVAFMFFNDRVMVAIDNCTGRVAMAPLQDEDEKEKEEEEEEGGDSPIAKALARPLFLAFEATTPPRAPCPARMPRRHAACTLHVRCIAARLEYPHRAHTVVCTSRHAHAHATCSTLPRR